jgi:hypothetical protein
MALNAYILQVQRLLNDELAQYYNPADLQVYINLARNTLASQTESLIASTTLTTTNSTQSYLISAFVSPTALGDPINVRSVRSIVNGVGAMLDSEPWPWFSNYYLTGLNTALMDTPTLWSMQNQGNGGNLWLWPIPNGSVTLLVEASWMPVSLVDDSTPEALSYPWTDAVPFLAAYWAYLNAQRGSDAQRMLGMFNAFVKNARVGVTPEILPVNWPALKGLQGASDATATMNPGAKPSQGGEGGLG